MNEKTFLTSAHWGTYRAVVKNGKLAEMRYFEEDPDPSPIGLGIVDALDAPSRITAPMVRESWLKNGPGSNTHLRGKEAFVEVSWEKAEQLVAEELTRVRQEHGSNSIFAGSYGWSSAGRFHHAQSQLKRFLNCSGGFTSSVFTYSFAAAEAMIPHVLGTFREGLNTTTSWKSIAQEGELVVAFGGIPLKNGQIDAGGLGAHRQKDGILSAHKAGVKFINISPLRSDMMDEIDAEWWAARPNTDVAIMLGLAYVIYSENLHDQGFLDKYCVGFEQFADYLTGKTDGIPKTPEWASEISEIPAEDIRSLAHRMVESRTMISASWSLTRQHHGEQPHWMAITLACMLGQIGKHGGGFGFGYSASNSIGADYPLLSGGSVPQGKNQVPDFIPVARIADLLLNPGKEFPFDGRTLTYPDIRLVWWAGGNPYHHHQDLNRLAKAWEKPDTIITNEWCWNANAKRADIVLPCTTPVERDDLCLSQRDSYVVRMEKAVDPPPNVRNDYDIFRGIARWMNIEPEFSEGMNPDEWIRRIYKQTTVSDGKTGDLASSQNIDGNAGKDALTFPDWETFCEKGWFQFPIPEEPRVMFKKFVSDPEKYPVDTPSGKIEIFSETVSGFGYADCPGHPVWMEPFEWLGNGNDDQLHMISNQPATKLHSQLDQGATSRSGKINGREPLMIHPNDANKRGIKDLDVVRLYNKRGSCLAAAVVTYAIRQGVVQISTGSWWDPDDNGMCRHGNPNALTCDQPTSMLGQGPTAHTCLVEVEVYTGDLEPITAFDPPVIKTAI